MANTILPDIQQKVKNALDYVYWGAEDKLNKFNDSSNAFFNKKISENKSKLAKQKFDSVKDDPNIINPGSTEEKWKEYQKTKVLGTETRLPDITPKPMGVGTTIAGFTRQPTGTQHYDRIVASANEHGISPALVSAGLFNESGIDEKAKDNVNYDKQGKVLSRDRGIAQINDISHPEVSDAQAHDPNFAIPWMAKTMSENIKHFDGDINRGIAAYNVGQGGAAIKGPFAAGLGPRGQHYLNKFAKNLTPEQIKALGIKVSSPAEEKEIQRLLSQ